MTALRRVLAVAALAALALPAWADRPGVSYELVVTQAGKVITRASLLGLYGQAVTHEVPGKVRIEAMVEAPTADGSSRARARFYVQHGKDMRVVKELSVQGDLARAAALEYTDKASRTNFMIKPRLLVLPGI